jgi:hypothetical protein
MEISEPVCDLASGAWRRKYGHLLEQDELDLGYRVVVGAA